MGGNRLVRGDDGRAVLVGQTRPNVAVERLVERAHLVPQPFELDRERIGGHVVAGAPELAEVGEPQIAGPRVGQLHEAGIGVPHRGRHRPPAEPQVQQLVGVADLGEPPFELRQRQALLVAAGTVHAPAVRGLHPHGDGRQLRLQRRIGGRRHPHRRLQPQQLAPEVVGKLDPVEPRRAGGQLHGEADHRGLGVCRLRRGVVGDVGALDPRGPARRYPGVEQPGFRLIEKRARLVGGRRGLGAGGGQDGEHGGEPEHPGHGDSFLLRSCPGRPRPGRARKPVARGSACRPANPPGVQDADP